MVIGLNHRTATLAMRERFWVGENQRYLALRQLSSAEGVEEVAVLSTCCRTEFLLWASEPTLAANSLLNFLTREYELKLSEWEHFYRLLDEQALAHIFRVASGLDSIVLGEAQIEAQVKTAWEQARTVGATGRFLNSIFEKALGVCDRVHSETAIGKLAVSIPLATLDLAQQIFGSLVGRKVLLLGAGKLSELSARHLVEAGAGPVMVIDQSSTRAKEVAERLGGTAATLADRWSCLLRADIAVSATGCPHVILTREEAERIAGERNRVALVIMDIAMPRDVDPEVRRVDGILLYDLEGLERSVGGNAAERRIAAEEAEKIVAAEAQAFRGKLQAESVVPTAVALRRRLEEICRQELEFFIEERGPFSREQVQSLHAVTAHVIRKIAGSLVRELRELPEKQEQEQMTAAITRLFRLESPEGALAGARSERREDERRQGRAAVINY